MCDAEDWQEKKIIEWIASDPLRMHALSVASQLSLPDWSLAAGFVRNLAWDRLHGYQAPTPLADIDLIYFDPGRQLPQHDRDIEMHLSMLAPELPWSVRNQARMHMRNDDPPYRSATDAMRHWVEVETAIGVTIDSRQNLRLVCPLGLSTLFAMKITLNLHRPKRDEFLQRIAKKNWLSIWPRLTVDMSYRP